MDSLHGINTVFKAWLAELKSREEKGNHDDVLVKAREEIARREANGEHPGGDGPDGHLDCHELGGRMLFCSIGENMYNHVFNL
jgi:hypothetical protein